MPDEIKNILFKNSRKKGEFGPPLFDETKSSYRWRLFKKGFLWGFMLGNVISYQYAYYTFIMTPALYTKRELLGVPLMIAGLSGISFGFVEIFMNPQKNFKPKIHKIDEATKARIEKDK